MDNNKYEAMMVAMDVIVSTGEFLAPAEFADAVAETVRQVNADMGAYKEVKA